MSASAKKYNTEGYVAKIDVLDKDETEILRNNFNILQDNIGKDQAQYSLHNVHLNNKWVLDIASHDNILTHIKEILGPNIILLDSRFICKYPINATEDSSDNVPFVAWHQDVRYWGIEGQVVTAWIAIDDADVDNGCMLVIPGSHKKGIVHHEACTQTGNLLSSNQSIPLHLFDISLSTPCPVLAGQASLHDGLLIHGSEPNRSSRRRCGFVVRYVSTSARPIEDPERPRLFPCTVLLCGTNVDGPFKDNKPSWY